MIQNPNVLSISNLSKNYGHIKAVQNLSMDIPEGAVFGLLGPNGSGKSTTLGMVLGVVNPTNGDFQWLDQGNGNAVRRKIGAILEMPSFYTYLSARKNLEVVAKIKMVSKSRIPEVLKRVGLLERQGDKFSTFSLGMKQRLAIAAALLPDPKVMILDEPTNGLDPEGIAEIRELIKSLAAEGRTIIIASHLLDEVQKICTDFAVLRKGQKIFQGKVNDLLQSNNRLMVDCEQSLELEAFMERSSLVEKIERKPMGFLVYTTPGTTIESFHKSVITAGLVLTKLSRDENSLERKFLEILKSEA